MLDTCSKRFSVAALLGPIAAFMLTAGNLCAQDSAAAIPSLQFKPAYPNLRLNRPIWLEEAPDGSKRVFVTQQDGQVLIMPADRNGAETKMFLDISARKPHMQNEEGLLGFAFHPKFKENHKFYVYYTQQKPKRSVISEFQVSTSDPDKADVASERILMEVPQPYWNHNGGCIVFGPDGYLYITLGDGGKGRDPHNVGQSLNFVYAKILRIDVNSRDENIQYGVPQDNPFGHKGDGEERAETWAFGLRNPWRISFDRQTGALWAGDVGQDKFEEVDIIEKGGNYGWSAREGFHEFKQTAVTGKMIDPITEYGHNPALAKESKFPEHSTGASITGGYVYRGSKLPQLKGVYLYGDFVSGTVWGLRYEDGKLLADAVAAKGNPARPIASFGEDLSGEVYALSFDGKIYEFEMATESK